MSKQTQKPIFCELESKKFVPINRAARQKVFKMSEETKEEEKIAPMKFWPKNKPRGQEDAK